MIASLPLFHQVRGTRIVVVGDGPMGEARRRLVKRAGAIPCCEAEAHHASLAFIALEDDRQARACALRLKRRGLLVNVTDRPELCDFTVPSVLDRDPVLIAVGTGGASAGLAKHLRLRLEAILPQSLGLLAQRLSDAKAAMRECWPQADERRRHLDRALAQGGPLDPLRGDAAGSVDEWLAGAESGAAPPTPSTAVEIILRSTDPDDLTLREARLLGEADHVMHDPDVPDAILTRARADAQRHTLPCPVPADGLVVAILPPVSSPPPADRESR